MVNSVRVVSLVKFGQNGEFSQNGISGQRDKVHLGANVSSSAHDRGCVVNGSSAMAAICVLLLKYSSKRNAQFKTIHAKIATEHPGFRTLYPTR